MNAPPVPAVRLQVGGTVVPDRAVYITRPEDEELYRLLCEHAYVNLVSSRQVGKSSLMVRAALRLQVDGWRFAILDLTSRDALIRIMGERLPDGTGFDASAPPIEVTFAAGPWIERWQGRRDILAYFGEVRRLAAIPAGKPSGAWAQAVGLALQQVWRERAARDEPALSGPSAAGGACRRASPGRRGCRGRRASRAPRACRGPPR